MDSEASESTDTTGTGMQSPDAARRSDREDGCWEPGRYEKLSKGDVGYGGNAFVAGGPGSPGEEGLLSQKLRSLGVQYQQQQQEPLDQQPREGQ